MDVKLALELAEQLVQILKTEIDRIGEAEGDGQSVNAASGSNSLPVPRRNLLRGYPPEFFALAELFSLNKEEAVRSPGRIRRALKSILAYTPDVTVSEIKIRAIRYKTIHPQWNFTISALVKYWPELSSPKSDGSNLKQV